MPINRDVFKVKGEETVREVPLVPSISWSRMLSYGANARVNRKGIEHYGNLINELLRYDKIP